MEFAFVWEGRCCHVRFYRRYYNLYSRLTAMCWPEEIEALVKQNEGVNAFTLDSNIQLFPKEITIEIASALESNIKAKSFHNSPLSVHRNMCRILPVLLISGCQS